ncbi:alternate-type signal peptide domain-containing protein [Gryllotalpicola daejeonensis]
MNRLFKGAIAGAAGVALLLGGAGTFALWNDDTDAGTDAQIEAGHLMFGTVPAGQWYLNGSTSALTDEQVEALALVPGDILLYKVNGVQIIAHGTDLKAQLGFDWDNVTDAGTDGSDVTDATAGSEFLDTLDVAYAVTDAQGDPVALTDGDTMTITGGDTIDAQTVNIAVTITFDPNTDAHVAMGGKVDLSGFDLTLKQVQMPGQAPASPEPAAT